jgi:hypothetical protein
MDRSPAALRAMNKLHGLLGVALALSLVTGCARSERAAPSPGSEAPTVTAAQGGEMKGGAPIATGRALVVTIDVGLTVADVDASRAVIRGEVERAGGYVADASSTGGGSDGVRSAHMELRVPSDKVRGVRAALEHVGEITTDLEKVQDVTEERVDLEARLGNARTSEKRILEIMATKTGAISDVIEAEKEIARIRQSIEQMEAQKRTLDGRVDLATVRVTLSATPALAAWQTPGKSISAAARGGMRAAQATAICGAIVLAAAAPFLLPIGLLVTGLVLAMRLRRRAQQQRLAPPVAG